MNLTTKWPAIVIIIIIFCWDGSHPTFLTNQCQQKFHISSDQYICIPARSIPAIQTTVLIMHNSLRIFQSLHSIYIPLYSSVYILRYPRVFSLNILRYPRVFSLNILRYPSLRYPRVFRLYPMISQSIQVISYDIPEYAFLKPT